MGEKKGGPGLETEENRPIAKEGRERGKQPALKPCEKWGACY